MSNRTRRSELVPETVQIVLQYTDDTWERLLVALERLEQVSENYRNISATRLDFHPDRDNIVEGIGEVEIEVHLQIKALHIMLSDLRRNHKTKTDSLRMLKDFVK